MKFQAAVSVLLAAVLLSQGIPARAQEEPVIHERSYPTDTLLLPAQPADTGTRFLESTTETINAWISGNVVIVIPKSYIAASAALLVLVAVMLIALRTPGKKRGKENSHAVIRSKRKSKLQPSSEQFVFLEFVFSLFDPLFFRTISAEEPTCSGPAVMEFSDRHQTRRFAFKTHYLGLIQPENLRFESLDAYRQFEAANGMALYIIAGTGDPSDPAEVFLIPVAALSEEMTYAELAGFKKSGMFFCNSASGRLV